LAECGRGLHEQKAQACNGYVAKILKPTRSVAFSSHPNNLSFFVPWSSRVAKLDALIVGPSNVFLTAFAAK
jgi:hypothetical protein